MFVAVLPISLRQESELRVKKVSKPQEPAERLLIADARTGSPEAFADLVKIYSPRIYNISLRILRNPADAEDNVQNVLWKAHRNMRHFEGRSSFSTWLFRIAVNEALMRIRECRPEFLSIDLLKPDGEEASLHHACDRHPDPERQCIAKDLAKKAFGGLSQSRVDLFIRNTVEGWTQRELAHEAGITVSALKSRIFHARAHMQEQLDALSWAACKSAEPRPVGPVTLVARRAGERNASKKANLAEKELTSCSLSCSSFDRCTSIGGGSRRTSQSGPRLQIESGHLTKYGREEMVRSAKSA